MRCILYVDVNFDTYVTFKMNFIQSVKNKIPRDKDKIRMLPLIKYIYSKRKQTGSALNQRWHHDIQIKKR